MGGIHWAFIYVFFVLSSVSLPETTKLRKMVFLGDSLTFGYGISQEKAFPQLIQEKLAKQKGFKGWKVINSGISGSTTASAPSRMRWILKSKPEIVFLALGANDGLRGIASEESYKNLSTAVREAQKIGVSVILAGMKLPPNYGKKAVKNFEAVFPKLAKDLNLTFMPFLLKDVAANPKLNIADGIHPNEAGHKIIAENVYPYLKKVIHARSKKNNKGL